MVELEYFTRGSGRGGQKSMEGRVEGHCKLKDQKYLFHTVLLLLLKLKQQFFFIEVLILI